MKKFLTIFSVTIISLISLLYLAFLFVLPNCVDLNKYEPQIKKAVYDSTGFIVNTEDIKLSTGWNFSAGLKAGRIDILYPNNEKFFQLKNADVKLSLLPLLTKNIIIDSVSADNIILRMKIEKDGSFYIEQFLKKDENKENTEEVSTELPFGLKFSDIMPVIHVKKYSISLVDSQTNKFYTLAGDTFKISNFVLNDKIKISAIGKILLDKEEHVNYDINLFSKVMPTFEPTEVTDSSQEKFDILYYLKALKTINLMANIKADLKLTGDIDDIKTDGTLDITNLSLKVKGSQLPQSYIKTAFSGNKISIDSNLNTSKTENINVHGYYKYGKNQYIDLTTKSDKISLSNMFDIVSSFLPIFGMNDIKGISADGTLKANFNIQSDFKKINSNGYLKVDNANVFYKLFNISVKNINSDIDFSRNQIDIRKASAFVNGAPISLTGAINSNAYANLNLKADRLSLKGLMATFGMLNVLKDNNINSGIVTIDGKLKGNLSKTKPQINVLLESINLYNKPMKTSVILTKGSSDITFTKDNKLDGKVLVTGLRIKSSDFGNYSLPSTKLSFDNKNFYIQPSAIFFNNSKIDFKGKVSNYADKKNNNVDIEVYGLIWGKDLKTLVPKEFRKDISTSGKIPMILKVKGNLESQTITAQALANANNYISYGTVSSLLNKTTLLNASMNLANNNLKINDLSLNALNTNRGLTENFNANMSGSTKIASVTGGISNLQNKFPYINSLKVSMPNSLIISIPSLKGSKLQVIGNMNVHGSAKSPSIIGQISIPKATFPTLKTNVKNLNVNVNKSTITASCPYLTVSDSNMGFTTNIDNNFSKGIRIKSMNLDAQKINLDTLLVALSNLPQNSVGQGTDLGVTLANGKGKIALFSLGGLKASDVTSNFAINDNSLKLNNITGYSYGGKIAGNASYNMVFGNLKLDMQGRGLSSEPALRDFTGIGNLINGKMDFDANNIKLIAGTEAQMMQSLRGNTTFIVSNGQMGTLGKLENLLYAQNILGNNLLKNSLGSITKAVSIKKTGDFKYIKGKMNFSSGWANISTVQTSGPAMSLYITGSYNLLNNNIRATMLGRLSNDVVEVLGPVGEFSFNKLLSYIPRYGSITSGVINQMTTNPYGENVSMLPDLSPKQTGATKEFKVILNGSVNSTKAIKSFKWLSNPTVTPSTNGSSSSSTGSSTTNSSSSSTTQPSQTTNRTYTPPTANEMQDAVRNKTSDTINRILSPKSSQPASSTGVADFINNLPDLPQ